MYNPIVFTELCSHHHNINSEHFYYPQKTPYLLSITPHFPSLTQPLICFLSLQIYLFQTLHMNGTIQYVVPYSFFHLACFDVHPSFGVHHYFIPFYWLNNIPVYGYTTLCFCISVDTHFGCFHFVFAIMNNVAINCQIYFSFYSVTIIVCLDCGLVLKVKK